MDGHGNLVFFWIASLPYSNVLCILFLVLKRKKNLAGQLHGELELSGAPSRGNSADCKARVISVIRPFQKPMGNNPKGQTLPSKTWRSTSAGICFYLFFLFCAWTKRNPTQISSDFLTPFIQHFSFTQKHAFPHTHIIHHPGSCHPSSKIHFWFRPSKNLPMAKIQTSHWDPMGQKI